MNGNGVLPLATREEIYCHPEEPLPALPSESEPDGGPVGVETRRRLMEWWEREYCAGRMRLAVIGRGTTSTFKAYSTGMFNSFLRISR